MSTTSSVICFAYRLIVEETSLTVYLFAIAIGALAGVAAVIFFVSLMLDLRPWLDEALAEDAPIEDDDIAERRRLDVTTRIPVSRFRS